REDQIFDGAAGPAPLLAQLFCPVGQQPVVPLLIPRQAAAAGLVAVLGVADLGDVMDEEAVLALLVLAGDGPGQLVAFLAGAAEHLLDIDRAAEKGQRGMNLEGGLLAAAPGVGVGGRGRLLVLLLVGEDEREPAVPEDDAAAAE